MTQLVSKASSHNSGRTLANKVAIVTGGGTGIGAAIAQRFSAAGASLVISGRRAKPIEEVAKSVGGIYVSGDISERKVCEEIVSKATEYYGGVDIIVANAGIVRAGSVVSELDEDWEETLKINVDGEMLGYVTYKPVYDKKPYFKIEFLAVTDRRYKGVAKELDRLLVQRMFEIEKKKKLKFIGIKADASYATAKDYLKMGGYFIDDNYASGIDVDEKIDLSIKTGRDLAYDPTVAYLCESGKRS